MTTHSQDAPASVSTIRILVVENDPQTRSDHVFNLNRWGYQVFAAEGEGPALLDHARQLARQARCQLALVDMRLLSDDDRFDISGLELAPDLQPTRSIIVTGFADKPVYARLAQEKGVLAIYGKEDGPAELRMAIRDALNEIGYRDVNIEWREGLTPTQIAEAIDPLNAALLTDEVEYLLRQLFPSASQIMLSRYDDFEQMFPSQHLSLLVQSDSLSRPALLKIGLKAEIQDEVQNYKEYLRDRFSLQFAEIQNHFVLWDLGGLVYRSDYAVHGVCTLASMFNEAASDGVISLIKEVFQVLGYWQHDQQPLDDPLFKVYLGEYEEKLASLAEDGDTFLVPGYEIPLPSPVLWALRHREQSRFIGARAAVTHGNLHADSILVQNQTSPWLINFERIAYGHNLRDFVALETDILLRLLIDVELSIFLELAVVVAQTEVAPGGTMPVTLRVYANTQTRKAVEAIQAIRRFANKYTGRYDPQEYAWSVLLTTLAYLANISSDYPGYQRAQLFGAILCLQLETEGKSARWPPKRLRGYIKLLDESDPELADGMQRITKLKQELYLLESDQRSSGVNVRTTSEIQRVKQELRRTGVYA